MMRLQPDAAAMPAFGDALPLRDAREVFDEPLRRGRDDDGIGVRRRLHPCRLARRTSVS